ncbi:DUF2946 domain-containing protein [Shimia sp. R11_0]|uniref:DUF2946 domain-containing protein n=1 Tax=Shimia sp. R11_0 TaxID=2821096 RepID=UPI001AD9991D|nr:DUF2946 domain-containing protein [Shimia sp. R11_0]MBO9478765.1 DUF2946 domain-containing protein [Shimia sp. R11_0]
MRLLTTCALLLAVLVSAAVPAGWMPRALPDGHMVLVICTGADMVELIVDDTGAPVPLQEQTDDKRPPCAFSVVAEANLVMHGPFPLPLHSLRTARWQTEGFTHESAGFHRRYDARGPPALS